MFRITICTLIVSVFSLSSFIADAYTMPADKLMRLSNRELCDKAQAHWNKDELDSALICFNIVANRADKKQSRLDITYTVAALTAMANIYNNKFYDFQRATECLLQSEQIALKHNLATQLASIYLVMASLEHSKDCLKQNYSCPEQNYILLKKAFHLAASEKWQSIMVLSICNLISFALENQQLESIIEELKLFQSVAISDTIHAHNFAKHTCAAAIAVYNKQYDVALKELSLIDCLDVIKHARPEYEMAAHGYAYFVYRDMKNDSAALKELDYVEQIAQKNNLTVGIIDVLRQKRDHYTMMGNNVMADKYNLQFHKARDLFNSEAKVAKADEERVLFRLNEANHEIKELSYKQRIQQTELIAVAVVAVLLLALLLLAWLNHRRTKQKNQSLYQRNQQLLAHVDRLRLLRQEQEEREQERLAQEAQATSVTTAKYGRGKMGQDDIAQVMEKVERVMDTSPEIFSTEFTLDQLVELTGESRPRLSQALNEVPDRSFYSILNEYRVREACRRMNDKERYSGLTIEAVGQSVGFKSRSNFVSTFKRIVGLTPSAYLKQVGSPTTQSSGNEVMDTPQAENR